jgi:peroxiredoxin
MKKLLLILCIPLLTKGQPKDGGFLIKGNISGLKDSTTVFLMNANDGKTVVTDVIKNGVFTLKGKLADAGIFQIGFVGYKENLELFMHNDQLTVTGDFSKLQEARIKGSALEDDFLAFKAQIVAPYIDKLRPLGSMIGAETDTRKKDSLVKEYNVYRIKAVEATNNFIKNKPASPVSSLVLYVMMPGFENITELEKSYSQLQLAVRQNTYGMAIEKTIANAKQAQAGQVGQVGSQAIDFTQKDVDGKAVSLSSFKGKYVLVDFWASWCRPCRMENPNVVNAYNQYKNKNFTVLGVSLDQAKPSWLQAIQADNLTWTHVSDLQYWNNAVAQLYHIQSIPANMLIDPTGKIIARDLRGEDLNRKLSELLK